jgi:hypothetical protein
MQKATAQQKVLFAFVWLDRIVQPKLNNLNFTSSKLFQINPSRETGGRYTNAVVRMNTSVLATAEAIDREFGLI